jgi:hypothetical protein
VAVDLTKGFLVQISPHIVSAFFSRNHEAGGKAMSQLPLFLLLHHYVAELMRQLITGYGIGMTTTCYNIAQCY